MLAARSRWKTKRQLYRGILWMHRAVSRADKQRRFGPRLRGNGFRQIRRAHHSEQSKQRTFSFAQHDGPPANDSESSSGSTLLYSFVLLIRVDRKDTREK